MTDQNQAPASPAAPADPRFIYQKFSAPALTLAQYDEMMEAVIDPTPEKQLGVYGLIVNAIRAATIGLWLWGRKQIAEQAELAAKQRYEVGQTGTNQQEIDQDVIPGAGRK